MVAYRFFSSLAFYHYSGQVLVLVNFLSDLAQLVT